MKQEQIIISQNSLKKELYDVVYSNVTVVNLLLEQGLKERDMHKDALASYYVDYYLAQVQNGGFSQYVYNTKWQEIVNKRVAYGLEQMKATKHLALFNKKRKKLDTISPKDLATYFKSEYFGDNNMRDILNNLDDENDKFYNMEESIIELNAEWLKNHPDAQILSIEEMFLAIEKITGTKIER